MTRAVIYARYSAGPRQTDQSIEGQLTVCHKYCEEKGLAVVGEYCDRHISGKTDDRPEFQRMIADARARKFDVVVVYKTDRFARNKYDSAIYKAELKKSGVKILYAAEAIPEGPEGIILESLLEGLAEYYSAELAQKIKRGMNESAKKAQSTGSGRPLGYYVDENKHFQTDPAGAEAVRQVFRQFIAGTSKAEIIRSLNAQGFRTVQGNPFGRTSLEKMLTNRKYLGEYKYQDVFIPGGMPRIISDEDFALAQAELARRARVKEPRRPNTEYLLSGKLFCGHCETLMQGVSGTSRSGEKYYYYRCPGMKAKPKRCRKKNVPKDALEEEVCSLALRYILQEDTLRDLVGKLMAYQAELDGPSQDLAAAEKALTKTEKAIGNLLALVEENGATKALAARLASLEDDRDALTAEVALYKAQKKLAFTEDQLLYMLMRYAEPEEGERPQDFRKRVIKCFVSEVWVYDEKLEIYFNLTGEDDEPRRFVFEQTENCSTNSFYARTQVRVYLTPCGFVVEKETTRA